MLNVRVEAKVALNPLSVNALCRVGFCLYGLFSEAMSFRPDITNNSPCKERHLEAPDLLITVREALNSGGYLESVEGTGSGSYMVKNTQGEILALFKPSDERKDGPQNRIPKYRKEDISEESMHFQQFLPGFSAERQSFAAWIDFGSEACLPKGVIAELESEHFVDLEAEEEKMAPRKQKKRGYLQEWIPEATPLVQLHPAFSDDENPERAYRLDNHPILYEVSLKEFQKIAIIDALLYNEDRHAGNILITKDNSRKPHLHPIDMDMILPGTFLKMRTGLFSHHRAKERLIPENLEFIQSLDSDEVALAAKEAGLPDLAARNAKALTLVLQYFGPEFSLKEIYRFITLSSRLSELIGKSERRSLIDLSETDRESYQKHEALRKKIWEGKDLTSSEETFKKSYQSLAKDRVESLVEKNFWIRFERGLKRELGIAMAKKTRNIIFGTTYIAGNPNRDTLSQLVSDNQQQFARQWDLEGKVVKESLLQNECKSREGFIWSQGVDCVPYWNKIAVLRKWLDTPPSLDKKEEWYILADDDMPVTNMNFNPYEAIDLLRRGKDSSIIIVRDVVDWKGDSDLSVNTGLLIVRKDKKSKEFMEKLWKKRNDPTHSTNPICPTLGTCQNQDVLHEQEAFARVISDDRSLLKETITILNPRDRYNGQEIALNTFNRDGRFVRKQQGWAGGHCFSYEGSDRSNPQGAHRVGDAMGQTAGVPIDGEECDSGKPRKFREDKLRKMIANVVHIDTAPDFTIEKEAPLPVSMPLNTQKNSESIPPVTSSEPTALVNAWVELPDSLNSLDRFSKVGVKADVLNQLSDEQKFFIFENSDAIVDLLSLGYRKGDLTFDKIVNLGSEESMMILKTHRSPVLNLLRKGVAFDDFSLLPIEKLRSILENSNAVIALLSLDYRKGLTFYKIVNLGSEESTMILKTYRFPVLNLLDAGVDFDSLSQLGVEKLRSILENSDAITDLLSLGYRKGGLTFDKIVNLGSEESAMILETHRSHARNLLRAGLDFDSLSQLGVEKLRRIFENFYAVMDLLSISQNSDAAVLLKRLDSFRPFD